VVAPTNPLLANPVFGDQATPQQRLERLRVSGDEPTNDIPVPGLLSALKGGTAGLISSLRVPALMFGEKMTEWAEREFPDSDMAKYFREQTELERSYLAESDATAAATPISPTFQRLAEAESTGEFFDTFMESDEKWTAIKELVGLSVPFSAGMIGGTAAGGLPGTFYAVFAMDWGDSYRESKRQGKDHEEAMGDATIKALTQAGFDTTTMGVARIKLSSNFFKDAIAQLGIQMAGGGGAEAMKHELVDEDYSLGEVLLEISGEAVTGLPEIAFARATAPKDVRDKTLADLRKQLEDVIKENDYERAMEELPALIAQIEERIKEAADEPVETLQEMKNQGLTGVLPGTSGGPMFTTGGAMPLPQVDSVSWWLQTEFVHPETGEIVSATDFDMDENRVVLTKETFLNQKIREAEAALALAQQEEREILFDDVGNPVDPASLDLAEQGLLAVAQANIQTEQDHINMLTSQREQEFAYAKKAQAMINDWVQTLSPDMKVVFSTNHAGEVMSVLRNNPDFDVKTGIGHFWKLSNGVAVVEVNLDRFVQADGSINEAKWFEAVAHEYGHALIHHEMAKASPTLKRAMQNSWLKWLKQMLTATTKEEYYNTRFPPNLRDFFMTENEANDTIVPKDLAFDKTYDWGMEEWTANQMAKAIQTTEAVAGPVEKFFKDLVAKLREFWNNVQGKYGATDTFKDFVNLMAAKTSLHKLESMRPLDTMTKQQAAREARAQVKNIAKELGLDVPRGKLPPDVNFPHEADNMDGDVDQYGFFSKWAFNLLQLGDRNPHITGLRKYITNIRNWWRDKMKFIATADERLHEWRALGDKRAAAVGAFLQDLTVLSYEENKRFTPNDEEFARLTRKHGFDQEMLDMVAKIDGDMKSVLDELYAVLIADANKTQDAIDRQRRIDEIDADFAALRNRNFFPLSRFGEYYLRVKARQDMMFEGQEYKEGDVITFEMFEAPGLFAAFRMDTPPELKRREKRFRDNALFEVASGVVNDTQREFAGLPPQFLEMMRMHLNLNEEQQRELDNLLRDIAPGRSFTKHMKTRKNVKGYSGDALRAYADYFMHFANYVARIKYKGELQSNISEVVDSANIIASSTGNAVKRGRIAQYMQDHFEYAMNPDNEWANLRAVGFLWYLGFVPKSAFVNLTQTVFVTQPWLASRFGDIAATKELTKAMKYAFGAFKNRSLREDQNKLIDYLIETGIIEESMATELAAVAEGRTFSRTATNTLFGSQKFGSAIRAGAGYGAWMFQMAERFNRRVTALAAYELVLKQGIPMRDQKGKLTGEYRPATEKEAFLFAQQAVEGSQFEYARFNRPRFMRGKKSIFFLFWQYMQNMLYFTGNDPGAARYILIMLLAAGLSGLPFAEDAMDIFDFLAKKLNKWFKDETMLPVNIRKELREVAASIGANPDLVMHGASRYGMGLPWLTEAVGLPMPMVDVSGSVSMGRLFPGIEQLTRSDAPMSQSLGRAAEQAGGAVASIPLQLIYAVADDNPDSWRRWERAAPTMVQHLSKALRYSIRGEATSPEGAVIKDFHVPEDRMDLAQVLFQAAGFADTEVNRLQEEHYMKKDMLAYYELRKRMFLENLDYARRTGDTKEFAAIMQDVRRYNRDMRTIGLPQMQLGPATLRRSLKDRQKKRIFIERGLPGGKTGVGVSRQVDQAFPDVEEEVLQQ
jgi:hypothetical protein